MQSSSSVSVIGGGLVGLLAAWRLAQKGHAVTLIDMGPLGAAASSAAAGMLAPSAEHEQDGPHFRLGIAARDRYFSVCEELEAASNKQIARHKSGMAYVALDEVQARKLKARCDWLRAAGFSAEWVADARSVHQEIAIEMAGAAVFPDEAWVAPRDMIVAAARAARLAGVTVIERVRVTKVDAGFTVHLEDGNSLRAERVVIAGGAWSTHIPVEGAALPENAVEPVRGVLMQADWAPHTLDMIIAVRGGYVCPRGGSSVIIGTSSEDAGFDTTVTLEAIASIEARIHRVVPSLGNARIVDRWAGLRPYARRDTPIVSASKTKGLFYATGHYRNGVLLAPLSADIVAAIVSGEDHPFASALAL